MKAFVVPQKLNTFLKSLWYLFFKRNDYQKLYYDFKFFFQRLFPNSKIYLTGAGRVSIYQSLLAFKSISPNKNEIIVTGFTCASVIDAVLRARLKPIYVDISLKTFGTDPISVEKNISKNTLAVIAQHSFGIPCDILALKKKLHNKNIFLIEDCAISFKSKINNKLIGSFGDISIFSFDHQKPINLLMGGAIVCNNPNFLNYFDKRFLDFKKPNIWHEISLLLYMFFDIITYIIENKNFQQFIRIIYSILKKLRLIGDPIIKRYYEKEIDFNNYNKISNLSLIIFMLEKSLIINLIEKRKRNYEQINSLLKNNLDIISADLDFDTEIFPLRIILVLKNNSKLKHFLEKHFDSRFFWFKEPIIVRERDFSFYMYNDKSLKNSIKFFSGVTNISLNLSDKKNKIFLQKFKKTMDIQL